MKKHNDRFVWQDLSSNPLLLSVLYLLYVKYVWYLEFPLHLWILLNHMSHIRSNTQECPLNCEGTQWPVSDPGSDGFYEIKVAERESLQQTMTIAYKIEDPTTPPQQTHPHLWFLFNVIPDSSDAFLHLGNCPDNGCNLYPKGRGQFSLRQPAMTSVWNSYLSGISQSISDHSDGKWWVKLMTLNGKAYIIFVKSLTIFVPQWAGFLLK